MSTNSFHITPPIQQVPFVFIVDSPSGEDLYEGYTIGMALRDALKAIRIPCVYKMTSNLAVFQKALSQGLHEAVNAHQNLPYSNSHPVIHLCMHGAEHGIAFTNREFIDWSSLRKFLMSHDAIKGHPPFLCMASCRGLHAASMANAYDSAFSFLVGNSKDVLQSDLTVAYLTFYHNLFFKNANVEQAVVAMRNASSNGDFFYYQGEQIKNYKLTEVMQYRSNL